MNAVNKIFGNGIYPESYLLQPDKIAELVQHKNLLRTVPTNSKVFLPQFMIMQEL